MMKDDVKPLLIYPTVYLITQFFPLVNRLGVEREWVWVGWREKRGGVARYMSSSCLCTPGRVTLRINNWANPHNPVFALWILHVLTVPVGGALTPQTQPQSSQCCPCVPHPSPQTHHILANDTPTLQVCWLL